jgi:riboflavin synthase
MFTGIIKKVSTVKKIESVKESLFVAIETPADWEIWEGESISINGVCSTIKKIEKDGFVVEYMPETIKKTTVKNYKEGMAVNLEKSMRLNDLLDGHIVQGHIDTRGKIIKIREDKESRIIKIEVPNKFMSLIADKGSVSVDGISLTVVETGKNWLTVSLVSYTLENTNMGKIKENDYVNIETDVLAKYIAKLIYNQSNLNNTIK